MDYVTPVSRSTASPQQDTGGVSYSGLIPVQNIVDMEAERTKRVAAAGSDPVVTGLAGHVRAAWTAAKVSKSDVEQRMLSNLRARRGEYDPDVLAKIREGGGSEVFMMISASKARAAIAWLRDTLLGNGNEKPWTISPTKEPELPPAQHENAIARAGEMIQQLQNMLGGPQNVPESQVEDILELSRNRAMTEEQQMAKAGMARMESKMDDQLQEGGFIEALYEFTDDISTFPAAILKGPVVRNKPKLTWKEGEKGAFEPVVEQKLSLEWERVSPFNIYPAPGSRGIDDGALIELHELRPLDLEELIGVEGYSKEAIEEVLKLHGQNGLKEWTSITSARISAEGGASSDQTDTTSPTIAAIQYWGSVLGKHLIDWGMDKKKVPSAEKVYHCEVWLIGSYVIKATLNHDPMGRKPYYKAAWEEVPGAFWGNCPIDLVADCQKICNNAARALANNMAIASGPQVDVNVDRIPKGEALTSLYPWKVWQTVSDPFGGSAKPVNFFQPPMIAAELMSIYDKFSIIADEHSGIPRYLAGDGATSGAGRTASGLSMLLGNAGKTIKSVIANIDMRVLGPSIERLFYYNMRYGTDSELKRTDVKVVARGAASLVVKEQAQVRRNEFLNIVLTSPAVTGIIGEEAIADLLRTMAAGLDLDTDRIIPPKEVIKARLFQQQQQALQEQQQQQNATMQQQAFDASQNAASAGGAPAQMPMTMPSQANQQLPQGGGQVAGSFGQQRGV